MLIKIIVLVTLIGAIVGEVSDAEWAQYKEKYGKSYPDPAENARRRGIYAENKVRVEEHNKKFEAGEVSWKMGLNKFADMTAEETKASLGFGKGKKKLDSL